MTNHMDESGKRGGGYHHGDLRAALIRAALEALESEGFETLKLSTLAKRLGVSQPAPYRHFADRDALLEAVAREGFALMNEALSEAARATSDTPASTRIARAYLAFAGNRAGLYRLMFASRAFASAPVDGDLYRTALTNLHILADALGRATHGREAVRRAMEVWAAIHGLVMLREIGMLTGRPAGIDPDELVDEIIARAAM